ncbi:hypothetical protein DUNSADRAFT_4280 [Dunaliella salina]|uniref:Uncharacterized protein n=1 Tax=Dunaliella salina TaxID=3046 RepID=A0ABQ7GSC7_DUNSA|nr:hypothetical protein DUNSADRAFT_4280 [Dunaliella salina]|eukprot:KAF5837478.1 hypothetical protein DUNSADRAFT_4280 [Dunaliella salina]
MLLQVLYAVRAIDLTSATKNVSTVSGTGEPGSTDGDDALVDGASAVAVGAVGDLLFTEDGTSKIRRVLFGPPLPLPPVAPPPPPTPPLSPSHPPSAPSPPSPPLSYPQVQTLFCVQCGGSAIDPNGIPFPGDIQGIVSVGNGDLLWASGDTLQRYNWATNQLAVIAGNLASSGDQDGLTSLLNGPTGLFWERAADVVYFTDTGNNKIKKINLTTNAVDTVAGSGEFGMADGSLLASQFVTPFFIVATDKECLYLTERFHNRLRKLNFTSNAVSTIYVNFVPFALEYDAHNQTLFMSTDSRTQVYAMDVVTEQLTLVAGLPFYSQRTIMDGPGLTASFEGCFGLALNGTTLYVADEYAIRSIELDSPQKNVSTVAGESEAHRWGVKSQA